jgi:Rrf2 family protein
VRISSKGQYAVQAIFDLAYHNDGKAAQIKDICDRQSIPPRFLEQVFQDLKRAGLVRSKRGPQGGYSLALTASEVRLGDIVRAIEGPLALGPEPPKGKTPHDATGVRVMREAFADVSRQLESALDSVTVADLCARAEGLGLARRAPPRYVYAI